MYNFNKETKNASPFVVKKNEEVYNLLDFDNRKDFEDAKKGFIANLDDNLIYDDDGNVVYDIKMNSFVDEMDAPNTVNPSLWRQCKLTNYSGLFKVRDGVYQIRNFDLANITAIRGNTGWILIDVLTCGETAKAGVDLLKKHVEDLPIKAVIYTHSHLDHFGGIKGVVSQEEVDNGEVEIIAPYNFTFETGSENVIAGNAMGRRAHYQAGFSLERSSKSGVGSGLGSGVATGKVTLIQPTLELKDELHSKLTIDGVDFEFTECNETEAVSEFVMFVPKYETLCTSEVACHTLHNLLTPRGAQIRSSLKWARSIDNMIRLYGDRTEYVVASHHWPTFGHYDCIDFLEKQRDIYLYLHNETVRLINHGVTIRELPHEFKLSEELEKTWHTRGYYGHINHDVKAIYQFYLGWYDANPSTYLEVHPTKAGENLIEMMDGVDNILDKCSKYMDKGDFYWVAEVLNKVVFANPDNEKARYMLADALEQIGYMEESGVRRNMYLQGAYELRNGVTVKSGLGLHEDLMLGLTPEQILDFIGIKYNSQNATNEKIKIKFNFIDCDETRILELTKNRVLNNFKGNEDSILTINGSKLTIVELFTASNPKDMLESGNVTFDGDLSQLQLLASSCDNFEYNFPIVTP
ncbi:alkyl sulfatase dimerization domain-containing protein [Paraclostridium ghonii]|uniref:alkyl/aryl-sulfatase n=1 Tax=Paraclostridium ghonii TaxID=29358 RepID=UPI00202CDF77|nr:alkyl sulfatase dimerization domain-containing protein [Paeniclostridium ghonii]MCM0166199.1 MBL fold metallo-hydrolase [Paeniclostridium ghonii]